MVHPLPPFAGLPVEAFEFYERLGADNTRTWWNAHKDEQQRYVRTPLLALLGELEAEFGPAHVFRPYRDVRFSADKTPIKEHQGAFVGVEDAIGYYVRVSAAGLLVGAGWYAAHGQQTARYRASVDGPAGAVLEGLLRELPRTLAVDGRPVKTRPRGVAANHPRLDLLRFRALSVSRAYPVEPRLGTRRVLTTVRTTWRRSRPLVEWLADHVGPAADPGHGD